MFIGVFQLPRDQFDVHVLLDFDVALLSDSHTANPAWDQLLKIMQVFLHSIWGHNVNTA